MLKIWGRNSSLNVQKVLWLIAELQLAHVSIPAGGCFGGLQEPDFLALNPHGRVPVIDDEACVVWESHAILRYLAARYGGASWWPACASSRSRGDRWMDWAQTALQPDFLTGVFWAWYRTPESQRNGPAIQASLARCTAHFQLLDRILAGQDYLAGQTLSLADIPAGTMLYRYFELDIERPVVRHVEAWYQRLQERPAYREQVMVPFAELYGRLDF
jgi:glutathione S-transferase